MTRLLVARHGQSEWNAKGRWQGQADPPLTELGRQQALEAARGVGAVDVIVASDLDRAATTASIIAEAIGVGPVQIDPRLRERHAGEWQGLTRAEIEEAYPGQLADGLRPPGWESNRDLGVRVFEALNEWATTGGELLVVSHGGVILTIEEHLGAEFERIPNLGGRLVIATEDGHLSLGDRVALLAPDHQTQPDQL